jgi:hypothetical protein
MTLYTCEEHDGVFVWQNDGYRRECPFCKIVEELTYATFRNATLEDRIADLHKANEPQP